MIEFRLIGRFFLNVMILFLAVGVARGADFIDIGYGARSIGLGRTFAGQKGDSYGVFGNPASLNGVMTGEVVSMYGRMQGDISYTMLGYVLPTRCGNFFVGYGNNQMTGLSSTTIDAVTGRPVIVSDFEYRNDLLMIGYERSIKEKISIGLRLKYYSKGAGIVGGYYGSGMNADAGMVIEANERLTVGVVAKNILLGDMGAIKIRNGDIEEALFEADIGIGYKVNPKLGLYGDVSIAKGIPTEGKIGIELKPVERLSVRLGGEQKSVGGGSNYINWSCGVGLEMGIFGIDYAYYNDSLLVDNSRHFVSISVLTPNKTVMGVETKKEGLKKSLEQPKDESKSAKGREKLSEVEGNLGVEEIEYIVVKGDTLISISKKLTGSSENYVKIAKDNGIKYPYRIYPSQKLRIKKLR